MAVHKVRSGSRNDIYEGKCGDSDGRITSREMLQTLMDSVHLAERTELLYGLRLCALEAPYTALIFSRRSAVLPHDSGVSIEEQLYRILRSTTSLHERDRKSVV